MSKNKNWVSKNGGGGHLVQILGGHLSQQNQKVDQYFTEKPPKTYQNDMNLLIFLDLTYNPCKNVKFCDFTYYPDGTCTPSLH